MLVKYVLIAKNYTTNLKPRHYQYINVCLDNQSFILQEKLTTWCSSITMNEEKHNKY